MCVVTETLRQYFSRYGDIVDCMVMKDPTTKRSRYELIACSGRPSSD